MKILFRKLRSFKSRSYLFYKIYIYGFFISFISIHRNKNFLKRCKSQWLQHNNASLNPILSSNGIVLVKNVISINLCSKFSRLFDCPDAGEIFFGNDRYPLREWSNNPQLKTIPLSSVDYHQIISFPNQLLKDLVREIYNPVVRPLEAHVGSYLRLRMVQSYRTFSQSTSSNKVPKNHSSFKWHHDNSPFNTFKLMIFLSDVFPSSGPFEYLLKSHRDVKTRPGFGGSRYSDSIHKKYQTLVCTGSTSDGALFDVSGIHRGGRTIEGNRDVLILEFIPSLIPFQQHFESFGVLPANDVGVFFSPESIWGHK